MAVILMGSNTIFPLRDRFANNALKLLEHLDHQGRKHGEAVHGMQLEPHDQLR